MATILIVDDESDCIELIRFVLEREGHTVDAATRGPQCLEMVEQKVPDLIILDVMMPDMDGYTVNAHLLKKEKTRHIPVLILTAKSKVQDLFQMASNVKGYISKPFEAEFLLKKVSEILKEHNKY